MLTSIDQPASGGYQPGVCNIGPAEIRRRRQLGYVGLGAAAALGLGLLAIDAAPVARMLVALPLGGAIDGLIQARMKFCAGYGLAGLRNMGELGQAERVGDAADRSADRRKAVTIHAISAAAALAIAGIFAVLSV